MLEQQILELVSSSGSTSVVENSTAVTHPRILPPLVAAAPSRPTREPALEMSMRRCSAWLRTLPR
eukprot:924029-Amorphochlora_amoeboformis.AAC.1